MRAIPNVPRQTEFIPFEGGADFVTPTLFVKPGFAREAQNFEVDINGGYSRIKGYERFDGQAKPSDAQYTILPVTLFEPISLGDVVCDSGSATQGVVIAIESTYLVVTAITGVGTFVLGDLLNVTTGSLLIGSIDSGQVTDGASTALLHATYRVLAAAIYRAEIDAVPGSGSVLGVWMYNDVVYAFRNNAGGTAVDMYQSTASGWSLVSLGEEVAFSNANTSVGEGDTLTKGGVTATIKRVVVQTGTLASGVNTGRLIISGRAGGNFSAGAATSTGGGAVTLSGAQAAITFAAPSGRFEFVNHNFTGSTNTRRMYGCDGKNRAFEFDGTVFVPIASGMTTDAPTHIAVHQNQLYLSFIGSVQNSEPGNPYVWDPITGATEIAMGDYVTGFMPQPGGATEAALAIFTRNNISILYGSGSSIATRQLIPYNQEVGGYAHSIQHVGFTLVLDDRGVTSLSASQNYGNFGSATVSKLVQTWLNTKRTLITASCVMRDKNQYRLFFSDGSALFVTLDNGKVVGMMPQLFDHEVRCCCSLEMNDGSEAAFFGSDDGYVYQMERGPNFDGGDIEAYLHLIFNASGNHRQQKRYRGCTLEVSGGGYAEINFSYELGYGSTAIEQPGTQALTAPLTSVNWDNFTWDSFYWDGRTLLPSEADMVGTAENVSLRLRSESKYFEPVRISGATLLYSPRRQLRANN